jgi:hypothetical protein
MISIRVVWMIWITTALALFIVFPAYAADVAPPEKESCVACHEDYYYLHDTGKWFCLCTEKMRCTCCHGGDPAAEQAAIAHKDMVLYPALKDGAICQECHTQDFQSRLAQFASVAGMSQFQPREFIYTPVEPAAESTVFQSIFLFPSRLREPWRLVGISLTLLLLLGSLTFVFFHWRNNHPVNRADENNIPERNLQ